jgi:hypothetical protein
MLYYHTDPQREFIREHVEDLAQEMRRVRQLTADEAGFPKVRGVAAGLIRRAERLRRRRTYHAPAYDV